MSLRHVYGLTLDSDVPFGALLEPDDNTAIDWTIRWSDGSFTLPTDPSFAAEGYNWPAWVADGVWYLVSRQTEEAISIDPVERLVVLDLADHDAERGVLIMRGVVSSLLLELLGTPVLHANALTVAGFGVAITGPQGAGKTTSSAALVAGGAQLVSDDVVALDWDDGATTMRSGPTDLRLRPHGTGVLGLFAESADTTDSLDGRIVLSMPLFGHDSARLDAIMVPSPSRSTADVTVRRLEGEVALRVLIGGFRVPGFVEPAMAKQRLRTIARLSALPVIEVVMPYLDQWTATDAASLHHSLASSLKALS